MNLLSKKCIPCESYQSPMSSLEIKKFLFDVEGWQSIDDKKITKEFIFKNFKEAMIFANKVADLAEKENHHPDMLIHGYKKVKLELFTHTISGLSENDFILAAKINNIFK